MRTVERFTTIPVTREQLAGGELALCVAAVDNEVRLFWDRRMILFASQRSDLPRACPLALRRRYTLRYNNNDGGNGTLDCLVCIVAAGRPPIPLLPISLNGLRGPHVVELPFMVALA